MMQFTDEDGAAHELTLIIGRPFLEGPTWRCPFGYGIDGQLTTGSCGGPGMVAALINASLTVEAHRAKLIDEPAFARLNKKRE